MSFKNQNFRIEEVCIDVQKHSTLMNLLWILNNILKYQFFLIINIILQQLHDWFNGNTIVVIKDIGRFIIHKMNKINICT